MDIYLEKKAQIERNEKYFDTIFVCFLVISIVAVVAATVYFQPRSHWIQVVMSIAFGLVYCMPVVLIFGKLDEIIRRNVVKSYWIEDCGDVLKLHGSVRFSDINKAYSDLLKLRPGYKIVDDAYPKYGCTLAAVKATREELDAKQKLHDLGINIQTIG